MPRTLLLADDSLTIQRVIELTFADENMRVVAVGDGRRAIDRIESEPPDIVLADVGMPGCDGYEVAAFIKSRPHLQHIPVVLLSGAFEPVDEARARQVGCDSVLAKPFEPQMVIDRVNALIAEAERGGSARPDVGRSAAPDRSDAPRTFDPGAIAAGDGQLPRRSSGGDGVSAAARLGPTDDQVSVAPDESFAGDNTAPGGSLDDYFDRLDAAFDEVGTEGSTPPLPDATRSSRVADADRDPVRDRHTAHARVFDGTDDRGERDPAAMYVESRVEHEAFSRIDDPPGRHRPIRGLPAQEAGATVPVRREGPTVAEAFTALLAAEQGESLPAPFVPPPGSAPQLPAAVVVQLVQQVADEVLARLTDRAVRETVTGIVSAVAERLVREEIERLKSGLT